MDLPTRELMGALRRARREALDGGTPAPQVAIGLLERIRGIGRRHGLAGCSDAEVDRAIAGLRESDPIAGGPR